MTPRRTLLALSLIPIAMVFVTSLVLASPGAKLAETAAGRHAEAWLAAHNIGTPEAIEAWIRASYPPRKLESIEMKDQVDFYLSIVAEFPELWPEPYEIVVESEHRAVVQYLSRALPFDVVDPDPTQVLVVEIDVEPDHPQYLARGVGLGALLCETKK